MLCSPAKRWGKFPRRSVCRRVKGMDISKLRAEISGFYIVSDGSPSPYRMHIRAPSFINLQILQVLLKGWKVSDVIAILGSIDIVLGEVDR